MSRGLLGAWSLSLAMLLSACGGGGGSGGGASMVNVPDVTGLAQAAATSAITKLGLTDSVTTQTSATVTSGSVISQTPAAGTSVAAGSSVSLVISSGPAAVTVPNVVGQTQSAATTTLGGAGLTLGTLTTQASATVPATSVISENPVAGTSVAPGTSVSLVISLGPPVTVPNLVGTTQSSATNAIGGIGLILGNVDTQSSATVNSGTVISQSPAAGASVNPRTAVNLLVSTGTAPANTLAIAVDAGPSVLVNAGQSAANEAFATVTICTPGSTSACQTIDHVLVDTGSVGLEILSDAMNGTATPTPITDPNTNGPLRECVQFADGYTWGSMVVVDVTIGLRRISNFPVHLIGDSAAGNAPSSCVKGTLENPLTAFGSNGVLGVGYFLQDCGSYCADTVIPALYYGCPASGCREVTVATNLQMQNPVGAFSSDNNGVMIDLPAVKAPGATSVQGTLYFGVSTQANNDIGTATFYTVDSAGDLNTSYSGTSYDQSFIDSGSNGYFFSSSITQCTKSTGFYCPPSSLAESAIINGRNPATTTISFTVDNADTLFADTTLTAFPNLAGSNSIGAQTISSAFDWGLPFFFGKKMYVLFETNTVGTTLGPASAF